MGIIERFRALFEDPDEQVEDDFHDYVLLRVLKDSCKELINKDLSKEVTNYLNNKMEDINGKGS